MQPPRHDDGEAGQGGVSHPLQLCQGLHWRDSGKTGGQSERAQGCMSEGSAGEVSIGGAHVEEPPSNQVAETLRGWSGQDCQGAASGGGHSHPAIS